MNKLIPLQDAVSKIKSGMTVMIGGFLTVGGPNLLLDAVLETDVTDLTIIANDTAYADKGFGKLIAARKVTKVITSHIGTNIATGQQYHAGELEIEFVPQGTLIERIRCAGAGLGGVLRQQVWNYCTRGKDIINLDGKGLFAGKTFESRYCPYWCVTCR